MRPTKRCFKPGARVVLTCEGKAERGMMGTVADLRPYTGPRMYADLEYLLVDLKWPDGMAYGTIWVRETWLALEKETV